MTHADTPHVISREVRYHPDGGKLLAYLCEKGLVPQSASGHPTRVVLLDSADIASKQHLTTIAVLDTSASIQCDGDYVRVTSTNPVDGQCALNQVCEALPDALREREETHALFELPSLREDEADEETRLKERATMEPLRVLTDTPVDHPHLPLVAGTVSFDYLATYESLPDVDQGFNSCPDYLFFLARIILVVDHPSQSANLVGASLDRDSLEQQIDALAQAIDHAPLPTETPTASEMKIDPTAQPLIARPTISDDDFEALVTTMQEHITAGDIYQVVPSRGFIADCPNALRSYRFCEMRIPVHTCSISARTTSNFSVRLRNPRCSIQQRTERSQFAPLPVPAPEDLPPTAASITN